MSFTADLGLNSRVLSSEDSWFETKAIAIPESGRRLCVKPFRLQTGQALKWVTSIDLGKVAESVTSLVL